MQESLFDTTKFAQPEQLTEGERVLRKKYALLEALDIRFGTTAKEYSLIEVALEPHTVLFKPGNIYVTRSPEETDYNNQDRRGWRPSAASRNVLTGFLRGIFTLDDPDQTPVLFIEEDCTDISASRIAMRLEDITEVAIYPPEARSVMVAYQNAAVDGDTCYYQAFRGLPFEPSLTVEELEPYVTAHWPQPTTIFKS